MAAAVSVPRAMSPIYIYMYMARRIGVVPPFARASMLLQSFYSACNTLYTAYIKGVLHSGRNTREDDDAWVVASCVMAWR